MTRCFEAPHQTEGPNGGQTSNEPWPSSHGCCSQGERAPSRSTGFHLLSIGAADFRRQRAVDWSLRIGNNTDPVDAFRLVPGPSQTTARFRPLFWPDELRRETGAD